MSAKSKLKRSLCLVCMAPVAQYSTRQQHFSPEGSFNLIDSTKGQEAIDVVKECCTDCHSLRSAGLVGCLAIFARSQDVKARQAAYSVLSDICKTGTDLFLFIHFVNMLSKNKGEETGKGWGRAQKKAISKWYKDKPALELAKDVTQCINRYGWSHKDVIKLAHVKPETTEMAIIFKYIMKGFSAMKSEFQKDDHTDDVKALIDLLEAVHTVKHSEDFHQMSSLIEKHSLTLEHVPTHSLKSQEIWLSLLSVMDIMTILDNIKRLALLGFLDTGSNVVQRVIDRLTEADALSNERVDPICLLQTLNIYNKGQTYKTHKKKEVKSWKVNPSISGALDKTFYAAFKSLQPTNKRYLLAINITSPGGKVNSVRHVTAAQVAATMAMQLSRTEDCRTVIFSDEIKPVVIDSNMILTDVSKLITDISSIKTTDCTRPIEWALETKTHVDVFVVLSDSDITHGEGSTEASLQRYRQEIGIPDARMVVCSLNYNSTFTIADTDDLLMFDANGFYSGVPSVIQDFVLGRF